MKILKTFAASFIFLFLIFEISACKDDDENKEKPFSATFTGVLLDSCNGSPIANQTLLYYSDYRAAGSIFSDPTPSSLLAETTTDANGRFSFFIESQSSEIGHSIRYKHETWTLALAQGVVKFNGKNEVRDVGICVKQGFYKEVNIKFLSKGNFQKDKIVMSPINVPLPLSFDIPLPSSVKNFYQTNVSVLFNVKNMGWDTTDKYYAGFNINWGKDVSSHQVASSTFCEQGIDSFYIKEP